MKKIIVASNNIGKINEVKKIIKEYDVISMKEAGLDMKFDESESTFEENAKIKASSLAKKSNGELCLADDSGIEIEYLNGFPGVKTKRWFNGTDRERNMGLIDKLKGVERKERRVNFVVAIAVSNGEKTICQKGEITGFIAEEPKGKNGFGFDEIFELDNGKTLAELTEKEKNKISARKIAIEKIKKSIGCNY